MSNEWCALFAVLRDTFLLQVACERLIPYDYGKIRRLNIQPHTIVSKEKQQTKNLTYLFSWIYFSSRCHLPLYEGQHIVQKVWLRICRFFFNLPNELIILIWMWPPFSNSVDGVVDTLVWLIIESTLSQLWFKVADNNYTAYIVKIRWLIDRLKCCFVSNANKVFCGFAVFRSRTRIHYKWHNCRTPGSKCRLIHRTVGFIITNVLI